MSVIQQTDEMQGAECVGAVRECEIPPGQQNTEQRLVTLVHMKFLTR